MQVIKGIENFPQVGPTVVTVGSFDGVHSGHSSLLRELCARAKSRNAMSVVVSFSPHPRVTLKRAEGLTLLSSDAEKAEMLEQEGVDILLLLTFDTPFSRLSYEEFLVEYLQQRVGMVELIAGFNHRMGHDGGDFKSLKLIAQKYNFTVTPAIEHAPQGAKVSSTVIRDKIASGVIDGANHLLSHEYLVMGYANQIGKVILDEPLKLLPPMGVYRVAIDGKVQSVIVDTMAQVWCEERDKIVKIKFLGNNEK